MKSAGTTDSFRVAPYGVTAWIWTIGFIAGLIYFGARSVTAIADGFLPDTFDAGASLILLLLLIYAWLRSVRGYHIEGQQIVITRAGPGRLHIPLEQIEDVKVGADIGSFFNQGFLSIGGVFGWAGRVRVRNPSDLESLDADVYGTNSKYSVLLELKDGRKMILTPSDPAGMEVALRIAGVGGSRISARSGSRKQAAKGRKR
jgi:Bacterial PH domain